MLPIVNGESRLLLEKRLADAEKIAMEEKRRRIKIEQLLLEEHEMCQEILKKYFLAIDKLLERNQF